MPDTPEDTPAIKPAQKPAPVDTKGMDAQQLAEKLTPEELAKLKAETKKQTGEARIEGLWLVKTASGQELHARADSQQDAVKLACAYLDCEPQEILVAQCKRKAQPLRGDRVLRAMPVAGDPDRMGYIYGVEPPE